MRTIAIVNQKGGCGKTTTAINLAALYAARGLRTLVVDMDPQSHCAVGLGVPEARIEYSLADALLANHASGFDPNPLIWEVARNLYLAPSTVMLSALEAPGGGLHQLPDKDRRLESLLSILAPRYDRCLIDCSPTIGLLTFNAMRAAREALLPVETGFFSLRGAERQWATIQRIIAHLGRPIACHLLATLHNPQSQLACNILAALRRQFAGQIVPVVIHEHEVLREAASFGQPVLEYAPDSDARRDFEALADWLEEHGSRPSVDIEVIGGPAEPAMTATQSRVLELLDESRPLDQNGRPPVSISASTADRPTTPSRAAELARRMHDISARAALRATGTLTTPTFDSSPSTDVLPAAPPTARRSPALMIIEPADPAPADARPATDLTHVFGVRQTSRGVLFVHPGQASQTVTIAGDFNYWSPTATPMTFNEALGVFESIVGLPPGTHQYRLVIDGQWVADPYNDHQQLNSYGEPNSIVTVSAAQAST